MSAQPSLCASIAPLRPCSGAVDWLAARPAGELHAATYYACDRGDWLLWLAARAGVDRRLVVLAACDCAEEALVHVAAGEERPRRCIEVTRAWCRGEATIEQVREARRAADDAAAAAAAYAAAYVAAAAAAAYADAAAAAADDAAAAAYAAADAAAVAARASSLAASARLVRARIPWPTLWQALTAPVRAQVAA